MPATLPSLPETRLRAVRWLVTAALFMEILDGAILNPALPSIAGSFGVEAVALNQAVSAYLLAVGLFIPASGWIADRLGARRVFTLAIGLFTLSSVACSLATSLPQLVALRALQGLSGAMMVPVGRLVILHHTPHHKLMAAMSALVWPALIAPVIGPPLGGFITEYLGWRWIFYLNLPLGLVGALLAWRLLPDTEPDQRRFDWPGFALCGAGSLALIVGLERLASDFDGIAVLACLVGVALFLLTARHLQRSPAPLFSLQVLKIRTFMLTQRGGSLQRMAIGSAPFLLPLMFQAGFGYSPSVAGLLMLAVFAGNLGMKTFTTPLLKRFGYRRVMRVNGLCCAATLAACAGLTAATPWPATAALLLLGGMARSMQFTALGTLGYADVPKAQMGDANGLSNIVSQLCMAAGVTLGALCIHLALPMVGGDAALAYRAAFIGVGLVVLLGLLDVWRLPQGAGDGFVGR